MSNTDAFEDVGQHTSFLGHVGGITRRKTDDGVEIGMRVAPHHLNPNGTTHGGVLITLMDITLGMSVDDFLKNDSGRHPITVQLTCNMMAAAPEGAWVTGTAQIDGTSRTMTWASGRLVADGRVLMTGSAVFRNPPSERPA